MPDGFLKRIAAFIRRRTATVEIVVATVITLTLVSVFYSQVMLAGKARKRVQRSQEIRNQIQVVYGKAKDLETRLQNFRATGNPVFALDEETSNLADSVSDADWRLSEKPLLQEVLILHNLVSGDSLQQMRVDSLNQLIHLRIDYANAASHLDTNQWRNPFEWNPAAQKDAPLIAQMQGIISAMLDEEYQEFNQQQKIEQKFWNRNKVLLRGGILLLYFGLLVLVRVLERKNRKRLQLESNLRENDILIRSIMDGGKHAIIVADKHRIVTFFNKAAERMLGYEAIQFVGRPLTELLTEIHIHSELRDSEKEWIVTRKDGSQLAIGLSVSLMRDEDGKIQGHLCIFQDISERKEIERVKSAFISTVSHELRTPLTSIHAALGLLRSGSMEPVKAEELISVAHKNSERLVKITNDILDAEKIEFGKLELQPEAVEVQNVIREALEANVTYGDKYGIRFVQKEFSCNGMKVMADPDRLMQVMTNLLSNAAKFSPPGGEVWIHAKCMNKRVFILVQDFGDGIPENFRDKVFEKFAQANPSSNRQYAGSGLGLSISKLLLEAMGGSIRFESQMGKGTTFVVDLPEAVG
ncbi:MAG TPA: hypothetical protein DCQ83_08715 [Fibrobacteres bacterium]|jgi:PAS domain S-box-containing protein|nr:hypothetical protein [Fibrobacterota bacterium]